MKTDLFPKKCPITQRPFFMLIEHPQHGLVPTYGGPYDSYTIPSLKGTDRDRWHEREMVVCHYDHDYGGWREEIDLPLKIIHDSVIADFKDRIAKERREALDNIRIMCESIYALPKPKKKKVAKT